jgi:hypothetical protein
VLARSEQETAEELAAQAPSAAGPRLCLRHLALVLNLHPSLAAGSGMTGALAAALQRASENMRAYALKREALRGGLITADEAIAYSDALRLLAGQSALALPAGPIDTLAVVAAQASHRRGPTNTMLSSAVSSSLTPLHAEQRPADHVFGARVIPGAHPHTEWRLAVMPGPAGCVRRDTRLAQRIEDELHITLRELGDHRPRLSIKTVADAPGRQPVCTTYDPGPARGVRR